MNDNIVVENLQKSYGRKQALKGISFTLKKGSITGLLGENGGGKSTTLKILSGLITNFRGSIKINGEEVGPKSKSIVSYLPEKSYFKTSLSANYYIDLFERFYEDFDKNQMLKLLNQLNLDPKDKIKTLSKGNREKLQLALCMSRRAKLYLLDEPIGGVDVSARSKILKMIIENYNPEGSMLISSHIISEIEPILDHAIFLKQGEIVLNTSVDELRNKRNMGLEDVFKEVF